MVFFSQHLLLLTIQFFKQRLEPTMVDPQSKKVDIDFLKVKLVTLEELQRFVNQCLNVTRMSVVSSDSDSDSD